MVKLIQAKNTKIETIFELLNSKDSICFDIDLWSAAADIHNTLDSFEEQIWISSSGSKNKKLIGLSRKALTTSAQSVNSWLKVTASDCWALALPLDHIGGLSILLRAQQANFKVAHYAQRWDPFKFCNFIAQQRCTLSSLVPTQLFDLISRELVCPPSMRAVIIGGAHLSPAIYVKARELGWPILPSYGLTECCSQVATASLESLNSQNKQPALLVLPHLTCKTSEDRNLLISGSSLLSAFVNFDLNNSANLIKIDSSGYFRTGDLARIENHDSKNTELKIIGREDRQLKIRGWFVSLDELEEKIRLFFNSKALQLLLAITATEDPREGYKLRLNISSGSSAITLLSEINEYLTAQIAHCPTISEIIEIQNFPLLSNGKIDQDALNSLGQ